MISRRLTRTTEKDNWLELHKLSLIMIHETSINLRVEMMTIVGLSRAAAVVNFNTCQRHELSCWAERPLLSILIPTTLWPCLQNKTLYFNMPSAVFTPDQVTVIKGFLEEFRTAPKEKKRKVVRKAIRAVIESTVRGLARWTLRWTLRLRLPPYILLILLSFYFHFTCSYLLSPSGRILRRTLHVLSIGPYYIHTFILRFIFNYRTISIYIISRTFYSLP